LTLGMYIALSIGCALYLLGIYRLPHDHDAPESIGVLRLLFSLAFLTLSLYLLPGLFKAPDGDSQRPRGQLFGWVESFLLPDTDTAATGGGTKSNGSKLVWSHNLDEALAQARRENKLVFVDFTGMLCTNCKLNERNVFPRPEVEAAFGQHVLLKLYTDFTPEGLEQKPDAQGAMQLRNERFETSALPLYALVRPTNDGFEIVGKYEEGLINDVPGFVQFLKP